MGPIFESVFQPEDAVKMPGIWAKMHLGGETSPDIWNWVRYEHAGKAFAGMGPPNDGPLLVAYTGYLTEGVSADEAVGL